MPHIRIMAIVNLTDDSFYEGSRFLRDGRTDLDAVRRRVESAFREGADIIDFGACSTRPGSEPVDEDVEWARLEPALEMVAEEFPDGWFSVDTFRSGIVRRAADIVPDIIVNDISAGEDDGDMLPLVGSLGLKYVAMHKRGVPKTMDSLCDYPTDIVTAVKDYFTSFSEKASSFGIHDWILDPGFGFAKTTDQNWELLRRLHELKTIGRPILVGLSRKRMIYEPLGLGPDDVLSQTQEAHIIAIEEGASILRVHDVAPARETVERFLDY